MASFFSRCFVRVFLLAAVVLSLYSGLCKALLTHRNGNSTCLRQLAALCFFLLLSLSFPIESFCVDADFSMVTTPSRRNTAKEQISSTISVVTEDQIKRQEATSVEEVLRNVPGVHVQSSGTPGEQTVVRIRGADWTQVLVLMDGVRLNSPWQGGFDFGNLAVDNVERIEILKGNQSAIYGSDALGGVINIISKKGRGGMKSSLKTSAGNFGTFREQFHNQRGWEKFNYSFSASRTDSSGQYTVDGYENSSLAGRAEFSFTDNLSLAYSGYYNRSVKEIGVGYYALSSTLLQSFLDENWTNTTTLLVNSLSLKHEPTKWWDYSVDASLFNDKLLYDDKASPEQNFAVYQTTKTNRISFGTQHNFYPWESNTVSAGAEFKQESADRDRTLPSALRVDEKRKDWGFYVQDVFIPTRALSITAGLRADRYDGFGETYNPKISASYRFLSTNTKIKGSWGTGYRAPGIIELYYPILGNPDLNPEKTQSYEIGVEKDFANYNGGMELIFFHIAYKDLIQRSQTGVENIGKAKSEGVEFSLHYSPLRDLKLSGNYTYQKSEDKDTGLPLRRPENFFNFNAFYEFREKLTVNLDVNLVGSKYDDLDFLWIDGTALTGDVKAYQKIDLAVTYLAKRWTYTNELKLFAKIDNLLDQDYFQNKGFKASGINFLAGARLSF